MTWLLTERKYLGIKTSGLLSWWICNLFLISAGKYGLPATALNVLLCGDLSVLWQLVDCNIYFNVAHNLHQRANCVITMHKACLISDKTNYSEGSCFHLWCIFTTTSGYILESVIQRKWKKLFSSNQILTFQAVCPKNRGKLVICCWTEKKYSSLQDSLNK